MSLSVRYKTGTFKMLRRGSEFTYLLTVANNSALFVYFKIDDQEVPGCIVHWDYVQLSVH